jgi:hypothetical protein
LFRSTIANIKIENKYIHFHLVCGYNPKYKFPGSNEFFSKYRKHLVVRKEDVKVYYSD